MFLKNHNEKLVPEVKAR